MIHGCNDYKNYHVSLICVISNGSSRARPEAHAQLTTQRVHSQEMHIKHALRMS